MKPRSPAPGPCYRAQVVELTPGELFVVVFITVAVVSAPWWPRAGAALARLLAGERGNAPPPSGGGEA